MTLESKTGVEPITLNKPAQELETTAKGGAISQVKTRYRPVACVTDDITGGKS